MKLMVRAPTPATVKRDFDSLFDRLLRGPLFPDVGPLPPMETAWEPALDLSETEKEYRVRLEVPGFHRENLDVHFDSGVLTLTGRRELREEMKGEDYLWQEREEGRFTRAIRIPLPVEESKIEATYENGVLVVKLPKLTSTLKARIAIK
jgi:HSP20 family protein